ncbi:hypothetical protein [Sulfurimonas sp. HSL3-2]|uniref:hypothetical protein n=1 Tax=Hydrocurvibacter mobilis TaxID=3131936 RepID=UPI0031F81735
MYGLSLEQAPPYKIPLFYYMTGVVYLLLFSIAILVFGLKIDNRFYYEAIAITHILTLGFFTHIMFGTLFQMVPVIIGVAYAKVESQAKMILLFLNLGTLSFIISLLTSVKIFMHFAMLFLGLSVIYFALYSIITIIKTKDKNPTVRTFITALAFLAIGAVFGILALLQLGGISSTMKFGDLHLSIMIFGWVFMLFSGVAYKILPMFYVAREYPLFIKNCFYIIISLSLVSYYFSMIYAFDVGMTISKIVLASVAFVFAVTTIRILKNRKRARSDITVKFFYFANTNLALGSLLWIVCILFGLELDFLLSMTIGLGFIYGLINGMLYKIVPFLTWFHLSSKSVFDAEMSEVIKIKWMKIQFYIFMLSFAFFILALVYRPFVFVAAILFFISSTLLLYNIVSGYLYHSKMIKKAVVYG